MSKLTLKDKMFGKHEKFTPLTVILLVVLIIYTLSLIFTVGWGLVTSFKSRFEFEIIKNVIGLPEEWEWNYSAVFELYEVKVPTSAGARPIGVGEMFLYGFLYALGCAFCGTFVPCLTAYLCAKFKYKFSSLIYTIVIIAMIIPIVGSLPSEIRMAKAMGLYNQMWGVWLMKANFLGMYFLVFHAMFKSMPAAYSEAAKIDGAGNFTIFFKLALPLARNTFFTVMLVTFIVFWNDYQTPLVYLPSYPTIARGMYEMARTNENGMSAIPMRMAGSMMMIAPILVLFSVFQKRLLGNLTVGGIKG